MNSSATRLCALLVTLPLAGLASGQDNRGGMLLHRQPTSIANQAAVQETRDSTPASFPSLLPGAGDSPDAASQSTASGKLIGPAVTVSSSLAIVLGLFAGLVWATRRFGSRRLGPGSIPSEVLQSLGSAPIDSRTRVTMLRCGSRILVAAQTATGMQPLTEITDPDEVRRLTAACLGDSKADFATAIRTIEQEKPSTGFLGDEIDRPPHQADRPAPRPRGRLFTTA